MATVSIRPGRTEIQLTARGRASWVPPAFRSVPGGLYPLRSAAFEVDEYRILDGWPVPVPDGDIRIECLVSAEGSVLGDRDTPTSVLTGADMRWVADVDYYDQTSLRWRPLQGRVSSWETSTENAPTLVTDYEYRVGEERFIQMTALNFDSSTVDYMWNDLSLAMGGTSGYTVLMVVSPNSIYGNDLTVADNALWGPAADTGSWMAFTVTDQALWLTTDNQPAERGVAIGNGLDSSAPSYVALVVGYPQTTLYAASGPSNMQVRSVATGEAAKPLSTAFWLGNAALANTATMDMALLDLGIYGTTLTRDQVRAEITTLSSAYGGDG